MNFIPLKVRRFFRKNTVFAKVITYFTLTGIGFVYLYPIVYMVVNSLFSLSDLVNPRVQWIPTQIYFKNFAEAYQTLDFAKSIGLSLLLSSVPAVFQTAVTACVGFGMARFRFPFKKLWFILMIATFLLPSQIMMVPRYALYDSYHMINTVLPQYLPALFGQGIRSTIFILVFYQYFNSYPIAFDEAAQLDGAGKFRIFTSIALPMAGGGIVLSLLFSFVWYWNETYQSNMFFGSALKTLPLKLQEFTLRYEAIYGGVAASSGTGAGTVNESITLAGTLLSILPLVILYMILQRKLIQGIEQTGITGE